LAALLLSGCWDHCLALVVEDQWNRRTVVRTEKGKLADSCEISLGICKIVGLKVRTVSSKISSGVLSLAKKDFGERFRHHLDSQLTLLRPDDEVSAEWMIGEMIEWDVEWDVDTSSWYDQ
jgi:hypothetical protein